MFSKIDRHSDWAPLLLRLFVGFVLIYGTQDNVFNHARMVEFQDFLEANDFPLPMASAYLSVYAQFLAGILLLLGLMTRYAAFVVVVNFIVALWKVHLNLPFDANIAPMAMLVGGLFFFLYGAPKYSLDSLMHNRKQMRHHEGLRVQVGPR